MKYEIPHPRFCPECSLCNESLLLKLRLSKNYQHPIIICIKAKYHQLISNIHIYYKTWKKSMFKILITLVAVLATAQASLFECHKCSDSRCSDSQLHVCDSGVSSCSITFKGLEILSKGCAAKGKKFKTQ